MTMQSVMTWSKRAMRSVLVNKLYCTDVYCEWSVLSTPPSIFWNSFQETEITTISQMMYVAMSSNSLAIVKLATAKLKMKTLPAGFPVALCSTAIQFSDRHSNRSSPTSRWRCWCSGRIGLRDCRVFRQESIFTFEGIIYARQKFSISIGAFSESNVPEISESSCESSAMLSCFTEITVRRSSSMPPSSLNWADFLPCSLLSKSPLSKALDARNIGWQVLYAIGVSSFLQFCPNFRLVYQNRSCTISFLIQVSRMTHDRKEPASVLRNFKKNSEHTFLCFRFLTIQCPYTLTWRWFCLWNTQVPTVYFSSIFESLRGCPTSWILAIFSTRTPSACHRCESIPWSGCETREYHSIYSSKLRLGHLPSRPHKALSWRKCTL